MFSNKYEDLFTSVPYNANQMNVFRSDVGSRITSAGFDSSSIISFKDVILAIEGLKYCDDDGGRGLTSDRIKCNCNELNGLIAMLLTGVLIHCTVPNDFLILQFQVFAMLGMLKICDECAGRFNVTFTTKKSKCVICRKGCVSDSMQPVFYIGGNAIGNVDDWPHLGHIIDSNLMETRRLILRISVVFSSTKLIVYSVYVFSVPVSRASCRQRPFTDEISSRTEQQLL